METAIRLENVVKVFYNKKNKKLPEERRDVIALGGISKNYSHKMYRGYPSTKFW
ncbi:MAG: hypothetical protein ACTSPN_04990 [Promethearchaeota archaeon]